MFMGWQMEGRLSQMIMSWCKTWQGSRAGHCGAHCWGVCLFRPSCLFRSLELGELLQKRKTVRQGVVMLTERAACMDYSENNDAEVQRVRLRTRPSQISQSLAII